MTVLLLLAAQSARAQSVPSVPPLTLEVGQEAREVKAAHSWNLLGLTVTPSGRVGELAPGGSIRSTRPTTLRRSPYLGAGIQAVGTGGFEVMAAADYSRATINSAKGYEDPGGLSGFPASGSPASYSEALKGYGVYVDAGKIVELGGKVRAAIYGAFDTWTLHRGGPDSNQGSSISNAGLGTAVLARTGGDGELMISGQVRMEDAKRDMYNNGHTVWTPSAAGGVEYARPVGGLRAAAGVEATSQRADDAVRPYLSVGGERVAAIVAAEARRGKDPFYPDSKGVAVSLRGGPADGVSAFVEARADSKQYQISPKAFSEFTITGGVSIDLGRIARLKADQRAMARAGRTAYRPADTGAMNQRLSSAEYRDLFNKALRESNTLQDFTARIPAAGIDGILATISGFTETFGDRNYNYAAKETPNLDDMGELYRRGRNSYLTGDLDGILQCLGSAQFAANLARALGERAGVPLAASAVTVGVPGGHAVTAIRTREYGIVFADWGRLTPTGTVDTKEALAVYQALQGMPEVYHAVTDGASGRHVGYLFSDEGRAMVRRLTYHGDLAQAPLARLFEDAPRGSDVAAERYKALLRRHR